MKKSEKIIMALSFLGILIPAFFGLAIWEKLPEKLPVHYNLEGVPDNFADKWVAVLLVPLFLFVLQAFCLVIDKKINKQSQYSAATVLVICPFLSIVIGLTTYLPVFELDVDMVSIILCAVGFLFVVIGNIMPKISRNKTMGIKIPWTLKSDVVWNKTHRLAGFLWFFGGIIIMIVAFLPTMVRFIGASVVFAAALAVPIIYAAAVYKKEKQKW